MQPANRFSDNCNYCGVNEVNLNIKHFLENKSYLVKSQPQLVLNKLLLSLEEFSTTALIKLFLSEKKVYFLSIKIVCEILKGNLNPI